MKVLDIFSWLPAKEMSLEQLELVNERRKRAGVEKIQNNRIS